MDLISLVVVLIVVGVLLYVVNTIVPMDGKIKQIINVLVIVVVVVWLLSVLLGGLPHIRLGGGLK